MKMTTMILMNTLMTRQALFNNLRNNALVSYSETAASTVSPQDYDAGRIQVQNRAAGNAPVRYGAANGAFEGPLYYNSETNAYAPGVVPTPTTGIYNGETIEWCVPSLGYILGDEGSAAVLGKRLVGDLLKNQLGDDLKELFFKEYETSMADIIEKVYRQPFPNRFLAKLSKFCADHIEDKRIHDLVYDHFVQFIRRNIVQYFQPSAGNIQHSAVGFVGSVAYYYRPILEEAMQAEGLPLGTILKDPIEGLKEYHKGSVIPTTV